MLQNQYKGMIFYPNNQKKTYKSSNLLHFLDLGRLCKIEYIPYALSYKSKKISSYSSTIQIILKPKLRLKDPNCKQAWDC